VEAGKGMRALLVAVGVAVAVAAPMPASPRDDAPAKAAAPHDPASPPVHRFFLGGDGVLSIENAHTHEKIVVRYRDVNGHYSEDALAKLDGLFRSRGDDAETRVSLRLVEMIDYLEDHEHPKPLLLVSGYRSEGYNAALIAKGGQAARTSMHTEGLAADMVFTGVDHHALWLRIRNLDCCGAGYYKKSGFLHVDTGKPRFWEETSSRVADNLSQGNARVIARTDFDRYGDVVGLEATLHAITLHPLRVSNRAALVAEDGGAELARLKLTAPDVGVTDEQGCITVDGRNAGAREVLRVAEVEPLAPGGAETAPVRKDVALRARVALTTCEPRLEATPARIDTNPIEVSAAALQARQRVPGGG